MILTGYIIIFFYSITLFVLIYGYKKIPAYSEKKRIEVIAKTSFSIIIPFRNEAESLPKLLESLQRLKYPNHLFEIILIDDDSDDDSVQIIERFFALQKEKSIDFCIIQNELKSNSPKKDAISKAIKLAKYNWIITTDADCIIPKYWLNTFDAFIQEKDPNMVAGPVQYSKNNSFINWYQQLDNFSLQTTTIGCFGLDSPLLCNGANLAYKKSVFETVNGFEDNNHIASGDDIFLMEKFSELNKKKILFLKSAQALVTTKSEKSWKTLLSQRIRWASKTSRQKSLKTKGLGLLVFLCNFYFIVFGLLCVFTIDFRVHFLYLFLIKMIIDFLVIYTNTTFFRKKIHLIYYFISEIVYPFLVLSVVLGSSKKTYVWKKRSFKAN